jgi:hypothetical protein
LQKGVTIPITQTLGVGMDIDKGRLPNIFKELWGAMD